MGKKTNIKSIKLITRLSILLILFYFLSVFYILPKLSPPPSMNMGPVGQYFLFKNLEPKTKNLITTINIVAISSLMIGFILYIFTIFLRLKHKNWKNLFIVNTLLALISISSVLRVIYSFLGK